MACPFPGSQRARVWTNALFDEHFFRDPRVHSLRLWHDRLLLKDFFCFGRGLFDFADLHHEGDVGTHGVHGFVDGALNESPSVVSVFLSEVGFSVLAVISLPGVKGKQGFRYPAPAPSEDFLLNKLLLAFHSVQRFLHLCEPLIQGVNSLSHALHLLILFFEHFLEEGDDVFVCC